MLPQVTSYIDLPVSGSRVTRSGVYEARCKVLPGSTMDLAGKTTADIKRLHYFGNCDTDSYGYKTDLALTRNTPTFQDVYDALYARGGADYPESQLTGLLMVAKRIKEVGFRDNSRRVVVMITDDDFHEAGDYTRDADGQTPPANDGDGVLDVGPDGREGSGEDYPSDNQVKLALQEAKIYPIFFCTLKHLSKWTALKDKWGFGIAVEIKGDSSDLVEAVSQAMKELTGTVTLTKQADPHSLIKTIEPSGGFKNVEPGAYGTSVTFNVTAERIVGKHPHLVETAELFSLGYGSVQVETVGAAALCPAKLESLKAAGRFQVAAAAGSGGWSGWVRNSDARDTDRSAIRSQSSQPDPPFSALHWQRVCRKAKGTSPVGCTKVTLPDLPASWGVPQSECGGGGASSTLVWTEDGDFFNSASSDIKGARAQLSVGDASVGETDYSARVRIVSGFHAGLTFRSSADGRSFYAWVLNANSGRSELWRHHDSSGSSCSERTAITWSVQSLAIKQDTWYTMRVKGTGGSLFTFYVDGVEQGSVHDTTLTAGSYGVYVKKIFSVNPSYCLNRTIYPLGSYAPFIYTHITIFTIFTPTREYVHPLYIVYATIYTPNTPLSTHTLNTTQ